MPPIPRRKGIGRGITPTTARRAIIRANRNAQPPPIPSGYYDPALDAQRAAAQRGYGDLRQDTSLAGTRAAADYGIQATGIRTAYTNQTADLARQFGILAEQQRNRAASQGILSGGLALQAAQKRAANQAYSQNRLMQNEQTALGQAGLTYNRGVTDRATTLARAGRENVQFGLDTEAERAYQAQQAGYVAPATPRIPVPPRPRRRAGRRPGVLVGRRVGPAVRLGA